MCHVWLFCFRLYVQHILSPIDKVVPELDKALIITKKRMDNIQNSQKLVQNFMNVLELLHSEGSIVKELQSQVKTFCEDGGYIGELLVKVCV